MPTNWETPTGAQIASVLNLEIIRKANQNTAPDAAQPANGNTDTDEQNRRDDLVNFAVSKIRAAIVKGGRIPLSLTANTVPTGATVHVLFYAAWQLINTTPNLNMAILTEKGVSTPYAKFYEEACNYIKALEAGGLAPRPSDPCGQDYANPPQPDPTLPYYNPAIVGVDWSDNDQTQEDNKNGFFLAPDGVTKIPLPIDDMNTY